LKIAAFSDIHANLYALQAVLADIARQGDDLQIVIAGDMVNVGPSPRETLDLLRSLPNAVMIAGNHEEYVLERVREGVAPPPYRALFAPAQWTASRLSPADHAWLESLPRSLNFEVAPGAELCVVHGSPRSQTGCITRELAANETALAEMFAGQIKPGRLWISGHTHVPLTFDWRGMTITNCGSVGLPFDGNPDAPYLLAGWDAAAQRWHTEIRRVPYDRASAIADLKAMSDYEQAGPFILFMHHMLQTSRMLHVRTFVQEYIAQGNHPAPPADFLHLEKAIHQYIAAHS
jgi:predicted phosphodiesterase